MTDIGDDSEGPDGWFPRLVQRLTPQVLRAHYSRKFFAAFLLVVIAIGAVGGVNFFLIQEAVSDDASDDLRSQANARALYQSQWVNEMQSQTQLVSGTASPNTLSLRDARERSSSDVVAIHYVDMDQREVAASTDQELSGLSLDSFERPWTRSLEGVNLLRSPSSAVWQTNESYERENQPVVAFVSPTPANRSAIVLVGSNERLVRQFGSSSSRGTSVYAGTGQHLFGEQGNSPTTDKELVERVSETNHSSLVEQNQHLVVYAPIDGTEWVAVTSAPKSELYQTSDAVGRNVIYIIITSMLLLVVVSGVLGRHTIAPLNRLRRGTQQLAENNFEVDLTTSRTDEIGQLYRDFGIMRDALRKQIRETREAKEEIESQRDNLQRVTTRLQLAMEETNTGVWEWDLDTDEMVWDEASETLYGYERGTFPGTFEAFTDRISDADLESVQEEIETAIETGEEYRTDFRVTLPDGDHRWIQARGVVQYDDAGKPDRILGIQTDITQRKERERELEATKRNLEQSNEKLEQFAGLVSHDLRNPLNAAKLRVDLLRGQGADEHVVAVEENLERMEAMIEDLLALSRAGMTVEEREQVSLFQIATESWDTAQTESAELEMAASQSVTLLADQDRLRHVFENLFRNVVDHNDPPLTVRVGTIDGNGTGQDPVGFFVEDNGGGIPEEERDQVFEHGYSTDEVGTGFGLSIVQDVVEAHDWEITVSTSESGGARFEITGVTLDR